MSLRVVDSSRALTGAELVSASVADLPDWHRIGGKNDGRKNKAKSMIKMPTGKISSIDRKSCQSPK